MAPRLLLIQAPQSRDPAREVLAFDGEAMIAIVLHRGSTLSPLAEVLGRYASIVVRETSGDVALERGCAYVAPPDRHLVIAGDGLRVVEGPKRHSTRPAIDPLFESAAHLGRRVVGVVLSGAGEDGAAGAVAIRRVGGIVLVQDPLEAGMPFMPRAALVEDDPASLVDEIAKALDAMARGLAHETSGGVPRERSGSRT